MTSLYKERRQRTTAADAWHFIRQRQPFATSGALWGTKEMVSPGRLGGIDRIQFNRAVDEGHIDFIVMSYQTPIAWYNKTLKKWHVVQEKFSVTTSKHQTITRRAIS